MTLNFPSVLQIVLFLLFFYNEVGFFFGLKDWAEVLKMYEKDDLYLGVY